MKKQLLEVNGIHLSVKESGAGPDLILVHGKGYSKENMDILFDHYEPRYHVISYDVRGHGESDKPEAFTLEDDAADLAALTAVMHLHTPAVIGFSMGSYITLRTAEENPDLFSKLVLIGTKPGGSVSSTEKISREAAAKGLSHQEAVQQLLRHVFAPQTSFEEIADFNRKVASPVKLTAEEKKRIDRSLQNFDLLGDAPNVTIPVLVLTGEHDGINPPAEGQKVSEALPHSRFEIIPHAGHIAFFENPDRVFALTDAFLAGK